MVVATTIPMMMCDITEKCFSYSTLIRFANSTIAPTPPTARGISTPRSKCFAPLTMGSNRSKNSKIAEELRPGSTMLMPQIAPASTNQKNEGVIEKPTPCSKNINSEKQSTKLTKNAVYDLAVRFSFPAVRISEGSVPRISPANTQVAKVS